MKVSSKHNKEFAGILTRFQGGLNKTLPPHAVQDEELIDGTNAYYAPDTGYLRTREGLKRYTDTQLGAEVIGIYEYVKDGVSKKLLVTADTPQKLYYLDGVTPTIIGNLTGTKRPSFAVVNGVCLIATGGALQEYDGTNLKTITTVNGFAADAPSLDFITDASEDNTARVLGCGNTTYRDRMFMSGIKDGTYWVDNATPETDAKHIDAGYKDGAELVGIGTFQNDAILFKRTPSGSARALYRGIIGGASTTWACPRYRRMHAVLSPHLIGELPDGLLFIDTEGPKLLTVATQPIDTIPYEISPAARNIAGEMAKYAATDGFIILDPVRMIAMVKPTKNSPTFYCMDFLNKRWTYFQYALNIQSGAYVGGKMLLGATDGYVYEYDAALDKDNGVAYTMTVETKWFNFFQMYDELAKEKYLDFVGITSGNGTIIIKSKGALKYSIPFTFSQGLWDWATVNAITPEEWTEDMQSSPMTEIADPEVVDADFMSIAISITSGQCAVSHLAARVAQTQKN
jgi:hypothetical protein